MAENLSVVLKAAKDLVVEKRSKKEPSKGEVEISMRAVGICATDVKLFGFYFTLISTIFPMLNRSTTMLTVVLEIM